MKQKVFSLILSLSCLFTNIFSQNPEWIVFDSTNIGYPIGKISSIAIDKDDNKWFGTFNGLLKYDNTGWNLIDTSNSKLPTNHTPYVNVDSSNNKWIRTNSYIADLIKYDEGNWTVYDSTNSNLPNEYIYSIAVDNNGIIWVGTLQGIFSYDNKDWKHYNTENSELPLNSIILISVDHLNNKWFYCKGYQEDSGRLKALVKFDGSTWTTYIDPTEHLDDYWDMSVDHNNNIWFGMNGPWGPTQIGLINFNLSQWNVFSAKNGPLPSNNIYNIVIDKYNNKWISSAEGLIKYDDNTWTIFSSKNSGLVNDFVGFVTIDKFNNKWISNGTVVSHYDNVSGLWIEYPVIVVYNENGVITDVDEKYDKVESIPNHYKLFQNYPNPFNPNTTIKYSIPNRSNVTLKLYDVLGREEVTLINQKQNPGNYEIEFEGSELTSGIYFYRLKAGDFVETKKMILLK